MWLYPFLTQWGDNLEDAGHSLEPSHEQGFISKWKLSNSCSQNPMSAELSMYQEGNTAWSTSTPTGKLHWVHSHHEVLDMAKEVMRVPPTGKAANPSQRALFYLTSWSLEWYNLRGKPLQKGQLTAHTFESFLGIYLLHFWNTMETVLAHKVGDRLITSMLLGVSFI